ncbi:MAG: site-2 protease family protein [archaeon]|nr:site-2 protease family protein [archaeon]
MKKGLKLFTILGIDIRLHYSWWIIFAILTWSLSTAFFPVFFPTYTSIEYWVMGVISSLLLFVSVLLHELSHSIVARFRKIKVESITLFFFGGVAGITREDLEPASEFLMAIAGPIFSFSIAGLFYLIYAFNGNGYLHAISYYLYQINFIVGAFNLVPGYPLDGGRAFRAILFWHYKDLRKATRIASYGGRIVALLLIVLGILTFSGGGLWFILIGMFLYFIAGASYEQVVIKEALGKISLKELIQKKFLTLDPSMSFSNFLQKYKNTEVDVFVVKGKNFLGLLDIKQISKVPPKIQSRITLRQITPGYNSVDSLKPSQSVYDAFRLFSERNMEVLPVMEKGKLSGIVSQKAVINRLLWELKFSRKDI